MVTAATFSDRVMLPVQVVLAVSALGLQHSLLFSYRKNSWIVFGF